MPVLGNSRHEIYCKHRAKGLPPAKAATVAGFATGSGITTTLESNQEIIDRIAELMEEGETARAAARERAITEAKVVGAMTGVSKSWVLEQLAQIAQLAANDGEYRDASQALELIGKELGMFQGASKGTGDGEAPPPMSLDKMTGIMDEAESTPALTDESGGEIFTPPTATEMPEVFSDLLNHATAKPNLAKARELTVGSETDVALHEDYGDFDPSQIEGA